METASLVVSSNVKDGEREVASGAGRSVRTVEVDWTATSPHPELFRRRQGSRRRRQSSEVLWKVGEKDLESPVKGEVCVSCHWGRAAAECRGGRPSNDLPPS